MLPIMILKNIMLSILLLTTSRHLWKLCRPIAILDLPAFSLYLFIPTNVTQTDKQVKTKLRKREVFLYISVSPFATFKLEI